MESYAILGFVFGIIAFAAVLMQANEVRKIKTRLDKLENIAESDAS
ncbi:MAG: hypothetical protein GY839_09260 [candidate division Zixibacteria bacterium]|nr:hypothetical protein [candidate division Zixibacteria bacterium]